MLIYSVLGCEWVGIVFCGQECANIFQIMANELGGDCKVWVLKVRSDRESSEMVAL